MKTEWYDCREAVEVAESDRRNMVDDIQAWLLANPNENYVYQWTGNAFVIGFRQGDHIQIVDTRPLAEKVLFLDEP